MSVHGNNPTTTTNHTFNNLGFKPTDEKSVLEAFFCPCYDYLSASRYFAGFVHAARPISNHKNPWKVHPSIKGAKGNSICLIVVSWLAAVLKGSRLVMQRRSQSAIIDTRNGRY
jgi:hypothetical protein